MISERVARSLICHRPRLIKNYVHVLSLVSSPHVRGRVGVWKWVLSHIDKIQRIWKWVLSHIDKIEGLEHVYKLVSYSNYCQLVLGWNLIWACMH